MACYCSCVKLASVRELKERLWEDVLPDVILAEAFSVQVGAEDEIGRPPPAPRVAFGAGLGPRPSEFRLAIRLFDKSEPSIQFAKRAAAASCGEFNAAFLDPLWAPRHPPKAAHFRRRIRPLTPGYSIGHRAVGAGTLGTFVADKTHAYILSNNHVLAKNRARPGNAIFQNAHFDAGDVPLTNIVGGLARWVPIRRTGNFVDAALSTINADEDLDPRHTGHPLSGWRASPTPGERVWKAGRTTGVTTGVVRAIEVDRVEVDYSEAGDGTLMCSFDGQIEIVGSKKTPVFSRGGDSGSVILDADDAAVGLLFAGNRQGGVTYANPLGAVFASLRIHDIYD
jgi:hypothetical protein